MDNLDQVASSADLVISAVWRDLPAYELPGKHPWSGIYGRGHVSSAFAVARIPVRCTDTQTDTIAPVFKMHFRTIAVAALASLVAADYAGIAASLALIDSDTLKLNDAVTIFQGNIILALPILGDNIQLNQDLNNGTAIANNSTELSVNEAAQLIAPVQTLANDVNVTLSNLISKYPQFKADKLEGIVWLTLIATKDSATKYSNAIISKVPSNLQALAKTYVTPISTGFDQAINKFSS